ncbi:glycine cleavage system protein GcvH [Allohahella marinimesophila]|uniref:Glycine cleavage system H protein n=1 Tax=Allohahella marinimesophila TaxID=1054972 RepID=A0ABP7PJL5_9GAMM
MSDLPSDLRYAATHEWAQIDDDGVTIIVGITDHAQKALGDITYIELPELGADLIAGQEAGVVESVKAASDIYAPISGMVTAINEELLESPELVNEDPYGAGWFFKMQLQDPSDLDSLLDSDGYEAAIEAE